MIKKILVLITIVCMQSAILAQDFVDAISDNSYFIEEAYNQEERVVQHILNGYQKFSPQKDLLLTFTQEWPIFSKKHQFSFTIGNCWLNSNEVNGIIDFMVSYRYQLTENDDFITLAPRMSIIIPTGEKQNGLGDGVWGLQFNLPMSKRLSNVFASHANIGYTLLPNVETIDIVGLKHTNSHWCANVGASIIWLPTKNFNLMLEGVHYINRVADLDNNMVTENQTILSPGMRFAIDINNLQIVPGLAVPITFQDGNSDTGLFFYLSFEHPF